MHVFFACAVKGGGEGRKGSGDKAYPMADPSWNVDVGVKYALVTTVAMISTRCADHAEMAGRGGRHCSGQSRKLCTPHTDQRPRTDAEQ